MSAIYDCSDDIPTTATEDASAALTAAMTTAQTNNQVLRLPKRVLRLDSTWDIPINNDTGLFNSRKEVLIDFNGCEFRPNVGLNVPMIRLDPQADFAHATATPGDQLAQLILKDLRFDLSQGGTDCQALVLGKQGYIMSCNPMSRLQGIHIQNASAAHDIQFDIINAQKIRMEGITMQEGGGMRIAVLDDDPLAFCGDMWIDNAQIHGDAGVPAVLIEANQAGWSVPTAACEGIHFKSLGTYAGGVRLDAGQYGAIRKVFFDEPYMDVLDAEISLDIDATGNGFIDRVICRDGDFTIPTAAIMNVHRDASAHVEAVFMDRAIVTGGSLTNDQLITSSGSATIGTRFRNTAHHTLVDAEVLSA